MDTPAAVSQGISSQSELVTTLSFATIGGLFAFLFQIWIHNASSGNTRIDFRSYWSFWTAVGLAGLSILFGYLISGMLIKYAPTLYAHAFDASKTFLDQEFSVPQVLQVRYYALIQFFSFFFGIIFAGLFIFLNRR
jgi:hypothetical protein